MVGWESNNPLTLEAFNASTKQGRHREDAIKRIRAAGIDVMLFIMVGRRQDTRADLDGVVEGLSDGSHNVVHDTVCPEDSIWTV
ncbi:hypothetical protein ACFLQU_04055 [Verrucomicrobiota bacterium]